MKFLTKCWEGLQTAVYLAWELGVMAVLVVAAIAGIIRDKAKGRYERACKAFGKWAWDQDKKLSDYQKAKDWATAFTNDGPDHPQGTLADIESQVASAFVHHDWAFEKAFWQRKTWWKFWEPKVLTIPQDRMDRINGEIYSDDPRFEGYREYDRRNPHRFDVQYDKDHNRIWHVEA